MRPSECCRLEIVPRDNREARHVGHREQNLLIHHLDDVEFVETTLKGTTALQDVQAEGDSCGEQARQFRFFS